jgi:hypothetical protein
MMRQSKGYPILENWPGIRQATVPNLSSSMVFFFTLCSILCFVVASAAEADLGALFLNCKHATIFRLTLKEMGHPQPSIPVNCDNFTAVSIDNNTVKRQRSSKENLTSNTFLEKKTLQTIKASTILALTISQSVLGIFMNPCLSANFLELASRAL